MSTRGWGTTVGFDPRRRLSDLLMLRIAAAIVLSLVLALFAIAAPPAHAEADASVSGSVAGTVVDADGAPLAGISVWIYRLVEEEGERAWDDVDIPRTDEAGAYRAVDLPPGTYTVLFARNGNLNVLSEYWNDKPDRDTADTFVLAAGEVKADVNAVLTTAATISGMVSSTDGMPAMRVRVTAYELWTAPRGPILSERVSTWTDAAGAYTLRGLTPGTYAVRFDGQWADLHEEWWDDELDPDDAVVFSLAAAQNQSGIDAELDKIERLSSSTPMIEGNPQIGSTLTADPGVWTEGTSFVYRWYVDGELIDDVTGSALVVAEEYRDKRIRVIVRGTKAGYIDEEEVSDATAPVYGGILSSATPVIRGDSVVGSELIVDPGAWPAGTTLAYQWNADGIPIPAATTDTLSLRSSHAGTRISVTVTGAKAGYAAATEVSAQTDPVTGGTLDFSDLKIVGFVRVGATLSATMGLRTPGVSWTYQWHANGEAIPGATAATIVPTPGLIGARISVSVTGSRVGFFPRTEMSAETGPVAVGTLTTKTPTISGSVAYKSTVTAKPGAWTSGTSFSYQWYANGKAIAGATKSTFKIGSAQKAKKLTVRVTGKKSGYTSVAKASVSTGKVATASTPKISGTAKVGKKLTAKRGTWTTGTKFSYQWYANGVAIKGATKSTYTVSKSVTGKSITVKVAGKRSGYATVAKTSRATAKVK